MFKLIIRTFATVIALYGGADAALSTSGSIPLPHARPDGIGATVPTQCYPHCLAGSAQASAQANWVAAIVAHLRARADYWKLARLLGYEGVVILSFVIDRNGAVHDVRIARRSGSLLLDGRSLRLLYEAQPFPLPPAELVGDRFPFVLPLRYCLGLRCSQ